MRDLFLDYLAPMLAVVHGCAIEVEVFGIDRRIAGWYQSSYGSRAGLSHQDNLAQRQLFLAVSDNYFCRLSPG